MNIDTKKVGKTREKVNPEDIYTKLIISQHKRRQLITYVLLAFGFFVALVYNNQFGGKHWMLLLTPVLVVGGIVCLIPKSEDWEYKAWQSQPRQIERHQIERK